MLHSRDGVRKNNFVTHVLISQRTLNFEVENVSINLFIFGYMDKFSSAFSMRLSIF